MNDYEATIVMRFDSRDTAEAWLAAAEEEGGKRNGELEEAGIEAPFVKPSGSYDRPAMNFPHHYGKETR